MTYSRPSPEPRLWLKLVLTFLISLSVSLFASAQSRPQWGETLLLALQINGVAQDGMLRAVRLREGLAVPQSVWDELHLRLPTGAPPRVIDGEQHVLLAADGPLHWRIDEATQTLFIDAPASAFLGQSLDMGGNVPRVTQPSAWAPFLNYDAQWQSTSGSRSTADALWELGLFSPYGDLSSTALARSEGRGVRLDTRWQVDDPSHMRSLRVGDGINQAGAWGRALRYGGVQWGTDFSLQPGFLSFPLPTLRGEAALPSTLDVYVNNGQRLQGRVQAGAFDLSDLPVVTGQGEIRTVVRDLLGREQIVVTPYYVSPALLKPGLRAFSVELGSERRDYGVASNHYGRGLLTATERLGITERFTRELRVELSDAQQTVGASGWMLWPSMGTLMASAVASHSREQGQGWMLLAGIDRQARDWSGSVQVRRASADFSQLGQPNGTAPRLVLTAALGTSWAGHSLGMSVVRQSGGSVETKLAQLNYGRDFGDWGFVGIAAFRDFAGGGSTLALSWSRALDAQHSAGTSVQRQSAPGQAARTVLQAQLQRNPAVGTDIGYQLLTESGGRQLAQANWQGEHVALGGGIARHNGDVEKRASASGGLAFLDGSFFASRRIDGGIALVDVGGHEGIRIKQDNQVVAHTDASGRAFVASLRGYQSNRIGVEASDLPMDAELEALEVRLTPAARSAALVSFPVQRGRSASFSVRDGYGVPLPAGTQLRVAGQTRSFPVGLEGRAYLAGLAEGSNKVTSTGAEKNCEFDLKLPPERDRDDLPDLGVLICR